MIDNNANNILQSTKLQLTPGGEPQKHIMKSSRAFGYTVLADGQQFELYVGSEAAVIEHDEHAKMVLYKGQYRKTNQMEFDPFNNTVSYIFD